MLERSSSILRLVACLGAGAVSCLPGDNRPPPAVVTVTVSADSSILAGIPATSMVDGWTVSFQRFLISLGNSSLDGDASVCSVYAEAGYTRIFDMLIPGPQRSGVVYGLGQCDFGFRVMNPDADSLLGAGVTEDDKTRMRTPGEEVADAGPNGLSGVSIDVQGSATKGGVTKTFSWSFRQRISFRQCATLVDGMPVEGLVMKGNDALAVDIAVHGDAFFQDDLDPTQAKLRFAPFADADDKYGNKDGVISLDELGLVHLADIAMKPPAATLYIEADGGSGVWTTLEDYVRLGAVGAVARFRGDGICATTVGDRRRPD